MSETQITTKLLSTKDSQATVEVIVSKDLVVKHRLKSVKHMAESVTIKGFRKGKAPLNLVENQLDPQKITDHTLNHFMPEVLTLAIKEHSLKVIGSPHLRIKSVKTDDDWSFEIDFPLLPDIKLGDYQSTFKTLKKPAKEEDKVNQIFDTLLKDITFTVPQIIVDEEVNQSLSRLIKQTEKLGLKIEDYLKTLGKTTEQLRTDYEKTAIDNLRLELILESIADDLKTTVTDEEIVALINATADANAKTKLDNPRERDYIRAILRKRKTIDALLKI